MSREINVTIINYISLYLNILYTDHVYLKPDLLDLLSYYPFTKKKSCANLLIKNF